MNIISKENLIKEIEDALNSNELAIFAGAGLSMDAGYCDWKSLLSPIAQELKLDIEKEQHDLLSLAQYAINVNGRSYINQLLSKAFPSNKEPTANLKILAQLPIDIFWTTNYDTLLEDSLKHAKKRVSIRKDDKDLPLPYKNYDAIVYKMHGDINSLSEAVISKDDYEKYGIQSRKLFRSFLSGMLLSKTFLFIGFSFNDPNFHSVLSNLRVILEGQTKNHYYIEKRIATDGIIDSDSTMNEYYAQKQRLRLEDLDRYGIKTCLIDSYDEISTILKTLWTRYKRKTIFISGSAENYKPLEKEFAINFIRRLTSKLIENGYRIVNGYGVGVGEYILNGAVEYCYVHNDIHIEDKLKLMPFPLSANSNINLKDIWSKYRTEMISQCGIAIYMFGNKSTNQQTNLADGMEEEFKIAKLNNLINIPLAFTGSISKKLSDENPTDKFFCPFTCDLNKTNNIDEIITRILTHINTIKNN